MLYIIMDIFLYVSVCKCNIEKIITNVNEHVDQLEVSSTSRGV